MSGPNVRGPYRTGVRRRAQIVAVATEVFGEAGFQAGSVRMIADRLGVSPASVIQHFGSKEGLLTAVIDDWTERTEAAIHTEGLHGLAYLRQLSQLMHFHYAHRGLQMLFTTLTAEAISPTHPAHAFIHQRYARTLERWTTELRWAAEHGEIAPLSEPQAEAEARLLIATADGLEIQWLLDPTYDLAGAFSAYLDQAVVRWQVESQLFTT